jgi:hypothetical protein
MTESNAKTPSWLNKSTTEIDNWILDLPQSQTFDQSDAWNWVVPVGCQADSRYHGQCQSMG